MMGFEFLLVVLAGVAIATPLVTIGLWIGFARQKKRIEELSCRLHDVQRHLQDTRVAGGPIVPASETPVVKETKPEVAAKSTSGQEAKIAVPPEQPALAGPPPVPRAKPVADAFAKFGPWVQENWFYAVSALSLALAGIFLVQYGMENGLLPPRARVLAALGFGGVLIGAGEYIRRRFGDSEEATTAYLPSVFSGAGIVTLFGGILSARMLYDLISGGAAMSGMVIVALIALLLGWLHGPLLAAIGIIGAYGAPVVLGSSNSDASPLFGYFVIVAGLGLGVDTIRRWGWISALTLVLAFLSGWGLLAARGNSIDWAAILYFAVLPVLAILIPARAMMPDHGGPTVSKAVFAKFKNQSQRSRPNYPTLIAGTSVVTGTLSLMPFFSSGETEVWLAFFALSALTLLLTFWSLKAPALQDLTAMPALALGGFVWLMGAEKAAPFRVFRDTYLTVPEAAFPWAATIVIVIGTAISLAAAWRSLRGGRFAMLWAGVAAVYAPSLAIVLEVSWHPAGVIGAYPWALHAAVLAAVMVAMAERFARADGPENRLRTSFAMIAALSSMAFAFVIVLSSTALTLALGITVLAAAALDRQWKLPPLSLFAAAGVATIGYRLIVDPGLSWGRHAPLAEMLLAYGGTLTIFVASLWLLRPLARPLSKITLDSAAWSTGGAFLSLLMFRWIDQYAPQNADQSHWALGLMGTIWLGLAIAQLQRTVLGGVLRFVRWGLAVVFVGVGGGSVLMALTASNPLNTVSAFNVVLGPPIVNTLIPAYLLPALACVAAALRLRRLDRRLQIGLAVAAAGLAAFWGAMTIRHFWQGADGMVLYKGFSQPELYSYTVALLLIGAGLFYQSLAAGSPAMRKAGLGVIGLAVAKVFLIDISGLEGLTRVFSLLILGLSLAGLAWLNRWAQARDRDVPPLVPPENAMDI